MQCAAFGIGDDEGRRAGLRLQPLADTLQAKPVASGALACTPAELQQQLHWLVSGSVSLLDGQQQPVVTLYPGELFGLQADGVAGVEECLARTDCTLVSMDRALVETLQTELPALSLLPLPYALRDDI